MSFSPQGYNLFANTEALYQRTTTSSNGDITVATPTTDKTLILLQITVNDEESGEDIDIVWTDSGGGNKKFISSQHFPLKGAILRSYIPNGLKNPNGSNGLLKITKFNGKQVKVDVLYIEE